MQALRASTTSPAKAHPDTLLGSERRAIHLGFRASGFVVLGCTRDSVDMTL